MSWSCPFHYFQLPLHVPVIFSVCPLCRCESVPYISRRADWLPCPLFPFHSPCTPLVFISVPFMSLSVPLCFPFISRCFLVMSTSYFLPSFPCTSLHLPCAPQHFPQKARFFQRFRKEDVHKNTEFFQIFGERRKSRQGDSSLGPLFGEIGSPKTTFRNVIKLRSGGGGV